MSANTLGDAWSGNDDVSYTGETGNALSMQYIRDKVTEFQVALQAADESYRAGLNVYLINPTDDVGILLDEYEAKSDALKITAETINAGAAAVNYAGGRMPVLSIPSTLGLAPIVVPAAAIAAVTAAVAYIAWGRGYASAMKTAIQITKDSTADEASKEQITAELTKAQSSVDRFNLGNLGAIAGPLKIIGIGILAFLAWKSFGDIVER